MFSFRAAFTARFLASFSSRVGPGDPSIVVPETEEDPNETTVDAFDALERVDFKESALIVEAIVVVDEFASEIFPILSSFVSLFDTLDLGCKVLAPI